MTQPLTEGVTESGGSNVEGPAGYPADKLTPGLRERIRASHLVVIDPQKIFASPTSDWGSPMWEAAWANIAQLTQVCGPRAALTRWLPTANRNSSWGDYFAQWPFADVPANDELYELTDHAASLVQEHTLDVIDCATFGKWGPELAAVNPRKHLLLTGVSTDCCVISTALAAADAGAYITLIANACAGSDPAHHRAAVQIMGLYSPQIEVVSTAQALAAMSA